MIPSNKKIALLHPYVHKKGGAVNSMIFLGNFLKKKGNKVDMYSFSHDENLFEKSLLFSVQVGNMFSIAQKIRGYDYIFVGNSPMQFVSVFSKIFFFSGAKIIWWHHHYPWYYGKNTGFKIFVKKYGEKLSLYFVDLLLANSLYIQQSLLDIYAKYSLVLHPVVEEEFQNYSISPKKKNTDFKTLISYARWVKGKNLSHIFDFYEDSKKKYNIRLIIGGIGEELFYYQKKYKHDPCVHFLGLLDKRMIIDNLRKSDLFLFPSTVDSYGISVIEAISVGVPVIAYNQKGVTEIIQNNKNGYLVSSKIEFTEKICQFLSNSATQKKLIEGCRETKQKFGVNNFEKGLAQVFLEVGTK